MTDVQLLIDLVSADPDQDIAVAMLIDELMEARGMLRSEADRHVERLRDDVRRSKQIDTAAAILAERGPRWQALAMHLRGMAELGEYESFFIFLVGGDDEPSGGVRSPVAGSIPPVGELSIYVPAGWALSWWKANKMSIKPPVAVKRKK